MIMADFTSKVSRCEVIIEHTFKPALRCAEALNASREYAAMTVNGQVRQVRQNKSLALHGDAVLNANLSRQWCEKGLSRGE
jgi:hypothetical protein